eukprot:7109467-Prymnesium_polylepis.1
MSCGTLRVGWTGSGRELRVIVMDCRSSRSRAAAPPRRRRQVCAPKSMLVHTLGHNQMRIVWGG